MTNLSYKSDVILCTHPPPPHILSRFKHLSKVVLKESQRGGGGLVSPVATLVVAATNKHTIHVIIFTLVCAAQALAIKVFPVPGGPYSNTPTWKKTNPFCDHCERKNVLPCFVIFQFLSRICLLCNTFRWLYAQIFKSIFVC